MLRPTAEELETARELGIDPTGMNGPQIREAIHRANRPGVRPSIREIERCKHLVSTADLLGVPINPGDGIATVKKHIEERLAEIFAEKGICTRARILFTDGYPPHAGKQAIVRSTEINWFGFHPMMWIDLVDGKASTINAYNVALYSSRV